MSPSDGVRVGIVGTSWWTEAMYLPALADHPAGAVTSICGRDVRRAEDVAGRWEVRNVHTDWRAMIAGGDLDAVIIATPNDTHVPITVEALEAGLDVLCDKPIALSAADADRVVALAEEVGAVTMTPFTYRYMPVFAETKRRLDSGFVGRPYHLNLRYFTQYARSGDYSWRFDRERAGSGVLGDLGSHWLHLAEWLLGPIESIATTAATLVERDRRPDGSTYPATEDSAVMSVAFTSGAIGTLQVCAVSWEGSSFGQTHHIDLHGDNGTVYALNDWDHRQEVVAIPAGSLRSDADTTIAPESWGGAPRGSVHDTYRYIFRHTEAMARAWLTGVADRTSVGPDLAAGARVQHLLEAALLSAASGGAHVHVPPVHLP